MELVEPKRQPGNKPTEHEASATEYLQGWTGRSCSVWYSTVSRAVARRKSGEAVWMPLYEDEIRSVEGGLEGPGTSYWC